MMPVALMELLLAAGMSLLVSLAYAWASRSQRQRTGFLWFFLMVLAATWAGGVWLTAFGPAWHGVHWLPFVAAGVVFGLLLVAVVPQRPPHGRHETIEKLEEMARVKQMEAMTYVTLGTVFWVVLALLLLAVTARYLLR
jgi:hypothetical protein